MSERPIIFSGSMVRALLSGAKTMTRRLLWSERKIKNGMVPASAIHSYKKWIAPMPSSPDRYHVLSGWEKIKPGDRLWVRENLIAPPDGRWKYQADGADVLVDQKNMAAMIGWAHHEERAVVPSIHMPRWASRLMLTLGEIKIERVRDISMEDMIAEGLPFRGIGKAEHTMAAAIRVCNELSPKWEALWRKLHGDQSWEANPAVVAISFKITRP